MPKLLLITASSDEIRRVRRSRFLNFQQITMPYLAALAPSGWDVTHIDEEAEDIDWTTRPDVAAITFHTPSAITLTILPRGSGPAAPASSWAVRMRRYCPKRPPGTRM